MLQDLKDELVEIALAWYSNSDKEDAISDLAFDKKEKEIKDLDPDWDYRLHLYPQGSDHVHPYPMDKVKKMQEMNRSMQEVLNEVLLEKGTHSSPKYDGGGLALYYREGLLTNAITRSSQISGKNQLAKMMKMVPQVLDDTDIVAIECEAICTFDKGWGDLSRQNACGLLNSNSLQDRVESDLTIIGFKVRYKDGVEKDWIEGTKKLPTVKVGGNITFMPTPFNEGKYEGNKFYCDQFSALIDGIVIYKNGESLAHKLYFNEKKVSKITKIEWNHTSSSLKYVPKYIYDSVSIDGTDCSRAACGGTADLKKQKTGVGAEVEVIKSGLTIPQVLRPTSNKVKYRLPKLSENHLSEFKSRYEGELELIDLGESVSIAGTKYEIEIHADHYEFLKAFDLYRLIITEGTTDYEKMFIHQHVPNKREVTPKELKGKTESEKSDLYFSVAMEGLLSDVTKVSSFNTSEDYSLPAECGCGVKLEWKDELNGGLYCTNFECKVNLEVLGNQLTESGLTLRDLIDTKPVHFIEAYMKCPRFGGDKKLKPGMTLASFSSEITNLKDPLETLDSHFHLSGLQREVVEKLNGVIYQFIKNNI